MIDSDGPLHATKKCPECLTYVPLRANKCPACKVRLGEVDFHGIAKRTINWPAYFSALAALAGFALYIWWAFLK